MSHPPTPEQSAILSALEVAGRPSLMVNALAGTGKSTTSEMIASSLPEPRSILAVAFNRKTKEETEKRFPEGSTVKTLNGLGHSAWNRMCRVQKLDDRKIGRLVTTTLKEFGKEVPKEFWDELRQLVSRAQSVGLVPTGAGYPPGLLPDTPQSWDTIADSLWINLTASHVELSRAILVASIREAFAGTISFDDQIYMPTLFGGVFQKYPEVMVDEAQDLSPLNHRMIQRCLMPESRLIVVGDPKQAIYAFRGADSASMEKMRALRPTWVDLDLSLTFRCPRRVVLRQHHHAPKYTAFERNPDGDFLDWTDGEWLSRREGWRLDDLLDEADSGSCAIICRNNAPLLSMAFKLIRLGQGVVMLGRDIGKNLISLSKKVIPSDEATLEECVQAINSWRASEISLAKANNAGEAKLDGIDDRADCLLAALEGLPKTTGSCGAALRTRLTDLFSRTSGKITLSTGHRSKGLEFYTVLHLDPHLVPSKKARANGGPALEQEINLKYVIETRSRHTLIQANLEDFCS